MNENKKTSDLGWELYPKGLEKVLLDARRYEKPLYILENGLADARDTRRADFICDHVTHVHKAIKAGVDVRGYFHWSLLDNFEWADGFEPRFGLHEVDFETFKRTPRKSAKVYAEIAKSNSL
jgi:beta-glucosidase